MFYSIYHMTLKFLKHAFSLILRNVIIDVQTFPEHL